MREGVMLVENENICPVLNDEAAIQAWQVW